MKFRYIGHPSDGEDAPRVVQHLGVTLRNGRWANVPKGVKDEQIEKLKGNPSFEVEDGEVDETEEEDDADVLALKAAAEPPAPDGKRTKAGIVAKLKAMQAKHPNITFDPKASIEDLGALLEAAEFEHGED